MSETDPYEQYPDRYDAWFDEHEAAFASEVRAIQRVLSGDGDGLEIGVGTGRFAAALGLAHGVDPSPAMRDRARTREIAVEEGVGEALPYPDDRFDRVLLTTTLCGLDDPAKAISEARRVLRPGGVLAIGFIDRDGPLGRRYERERGTSPFYRDARFYPASEVLDILDEAGFEDLATWQTLFSDPDEMSEPDPIRPGHGEGGFVVIGATICD